MTIQTQGFRKTGKSGTVNFLFAAVAGACLGAGTAFGTCAGDSGVAGEWIFESEADVPGWAVNLGGDGDWGNLGLTGGAGFSTNVPGVNCGCGHSLELPGTNGAAGAVSVASYDPLAGAEKFTVMAWVRRESASGENLSARIFSDADSTALADTTAGVEFRFSGSAGNLALRINGTEVATTVGGVAPESGEWHHVAAVYDGTRAATNYATRNVHFYVDGVQKGVGSVLQGVVVASNDAPVVVGNASAARTAGNLLVGNMDDVLVIPGWAPEAAGNGNASEPIQCFMSWADDIFPPGISAPGDVEAEAGECLEPVAVELGSPAAWDDCGVAGVANDAPETFGVGETTVTWTATDVAGNTASAVQTVTVFPSATGDCDGDGLTDWEEEMELGTDATLWDTDGDGWGDGEEAAAGFDPLDAGDVPKVLLNAVMYNPSGTDTGREWVEVQSASVRDVDLGGFRLEVGRDGVWTLAAELAAETVLGPGQCLLIGESAVSNADVTAVLAIPNAWTNEATTGVRLRRGGAAGRVADAVFIGGSAEFNAAGLDATGWADTNSVWTHAGCVLERRFPGVDNDLSCDWHEVAGHDGRDTTAVPDFDGDGLSDGDEWSGRLNPWGEPTTPWRADSDGDGLGDYAECVTHGTNPNAWASDGDIYPRPPPSGAVSDWWGSDPYEIGHGWDPLVADENTNGVPDSWEMAFPGDGLSADADGDGLSNLDELLQNSDPLDGDSSTAEPYVLRFESSLSGWSNDGQTDVGLGGWVKVCFHGWSGGPGDRIGVAVSEGNVLEEFSVAWQGAAEAATAWAEDKSWVVASASPGENAFLRIWDSALHPDFTATLGGEYNVLKLPVDLSMAGTTEDEENTRGGFVPVNADNDNGSAISNCIPTVRDFAASNYTDDDLVPISLSASIPEVFGGTLRLSKRKNGRGEIRIWDTAHKDNEIALPASWAVGGSALPATLWVEGCGPSGALRDTELTLAYVQNGKIQSQDSLLITVTPVLKTLYTEASSFSPFLFTDANKRCIASGGPCLAGVCPGIRFGAEVESVSGNPKGRVRLIQHGWIDNLLDGNVGVFGVNGERYRMILDDLDASTGLVDATDDTFPFYSDPGSTSVQNSSQDSPELNLNYSHLWPESPEMGSRIDIRARFRLSAVWQFDDETVYFLGNTWWNTRFQGILTNESGCIVFRGGNENRTIGDSDYSVDNTECRTSPPIAAERARYVQVVGDGRSLADNSAPCDEHKSKTTEEGMNLNKTGLALMAALAVGPADAGVNDCFPGSENDPGWVAYMNQGWIYAHGDHHRVYYALSNDMFQVGIEDWRIPDEMIRFRGVCILKEDMRKPSLIRSMYSVYTLLENPPAPPTPEEISAFRATAKWDDPLPGVYNAPPPKPVREVDPPMEAQRLADGRIAVGCGLQGEFFVMAEVAEEEVPEGVEIREPWTWPKNIHPVVESAERDALVAEWLRGAGGAEKE